MIEALKETASRIEAALADEIVSAKVESGELNVTIEGRDIVKVLKFLKEDAECRFESLVDVSGVDYPERPRRFDVVYHLLSYTHNQRIRVRVETDEKTTVPTVTGVYKSADWYEREVWDLYGVVFSGHPDLRRILTDYGFNGHPQRKDFPLTGFVELRYSEEQKRVVYEPVKLTQEFRNFDFLSPWEGAKYILPGDEKASREDKQ